MENSPSSNHPRSLSSGWLKWPPVRYALAARALRREFEVELARLGWPFSPGLSAIVDQLILVEDAAPSLPAGARP
jgi:hypothetical protein